MIICPACMTENDDSAVVCNTCGYSPLSTEQNAPQHSPLNLPPGQILKQGRYRIEKALGKGGFGVTYLATDMTTSKKVAIKELFPDGGIMRLGTSLQWSLPNEQRQFIQKFLLEAKYLSQCKHPYIVTVRAAFEENNTAYIVMDFVEGKALTAILEKEKPLPEARVKRYLIQVTQALKVVHGNGLLHRDINPNNILIDSQDNAILIDFGNAREFIEGKSKDMTRILTPGYAPIEQYINTAKRGPSTDFYALCATMYELLTGTIPPDSLERHTGDNLIPPRQLVPSLNPITEQVILTGLRIRAEDRFQTADEMIEALQDRLISPIVRRARTLVQGQKLTEAVEAYRQCLSNEPHNGEAMVELAMLLVHVNLQEADAIAQKAIQLKPDDGRGYGVLGLLHCRRKNWSQAQSYLEKAIHLAPNESWIHANLAWALGKLEKWQEAESAANRAGQLNNQCSFTLGLQAWIAGNQQQWKQAIRYARPAIFKDQHERSHSSWIYPCLIIALQKAVISQQSTDVERALQAFVGQFPNHPFAIAFQGWQHACEGLWTEALGSFQQLRGQGSIPEWALFNKGVTQEHLQNWQDAIASYELLIQYSSNPIGYYRLGTVYAKAGQWSQAHTHLEKAIHLQPNYAEAYHNLGWTLLNLKNTSGELQHFREMWSAYRKAYQLYNEQFKQQPAQQIQQAFQNAGIRLE